jgi:hypothetical protein
MQPTAPARALCFILLTTVMLATSATEVLAGAAGPDLGDNPWTMCAKAANRIERQQGIPRQLLRAISKAESGRFHREKEVVMAWPWTVMAERRGRYLETKAAAIAEVRALQSRGVRNIDVGCMQVNLQYHPHAFASLEDAFDPWANVSYAASFLKSLATEEGSWAKAAAYYHSQTPERYRAYRAKVRQIWATEREKYLLALDRLRAEHRQALTLANLLRVDGPLAVASGEARLRTDVARRGFLPTGPILLRGTATHAQPWVPPSSGTALRPPPGILVFNRAGPVRLQVVADLM